MKKILLMIAAWLYKNVRINKSQAINYLDIIDSDRDGYITIGEVISTINNLIKRIR